jgi:hypothetical protein
MHTGPELGAALKGAMAKKGVTQKDVAKAFGITQPSVSEWIKFGRIGKQHIPALVAYFKDVAGPEHWGLPSAWDTPAPPASGTNEDFAVSIAHLMQMIAATPPHLRLLAVANAETAVMDVRTGTAEVVHSLQEKRASSRPIRGHQEGEGT